VDPRTRRYGEALEVLLVVTGSKLLERTASLLDAAARLVLRRDSRA